MLLAIGLLLVMALAMGFALLLRPVTHRAAHPAGSNAPAIAQSSPAAAMPTLRRLS
jgi:hypothetical protein